MSNLVLIPGHREGIGVVSLRPGIKAFIVYTQCMYSILNSLLPISNTKNMLGMHLQFLS